MISPKDYEKLAVGAAVEIRWIGAGEKTRDVGRLLYAYARMHPVADETGKVIRLELRPARAGLQLTDRPVSLHYTNGFEVHQCDAP